MKNDTIRRQMGRLLLQWALHLLPMWSAEKKALQPAMDQIRAYERYQGLTMLMEQYPVSFENWRRQWAGMTRMQRRPIPFPQKSGTTARDRALMGEAVAR